MYTPLNRGISSKLNVMDMRGRAGCGRWWARMPTTEALNNNEGLKGRSVERTSLVRDVALCDFPLLTFIDP